MKNTEGLLPRSGKFLLVASTGGHLTQIKLLYSMLGLSDESSWITFKNAQSMSMLEGCEVEFVPYVASRDWWGAMKASWTIRRVLRSGNYDGVMSTGAAVGVPAMFVAALLDIPAFFIDSFSRVDGPSLTGKICRWVPRVQTFTQHKSWSDRNWNYDLNILESYTNIRSVSQSRDCDNSKPLKDQPKSIFVSLGTIKPYRFDALVDAIKILADANGFDVTWQLGETRRDDLLGTSYTQVGASDFMELAGRADVVVTHAGVASCLQLVEAGIWPIVVPRRSSRGEHIDDHQRQIAIALSERGLCAMREVDQIELSDFQSAFDRKSISDGLF